jgi:hypothetical protein
MSFQHIRFAQCKLRLESNKNILSSSVFLNGFLAFLEKASLHGNDNRGKGVGTNIFSPLVPRTSLVGEIRVRGNYKSALITGLRLHPHLASPLKGEQYLFLSFEV